MSAIINGEKYTTFIDYIHDEEKVSKGERAQMEFEAALIGKQIEDRETNGFSQGVPGDLS